MIVLSSPQIMQETALRWKRDHRVGLVTTMGCLHEGHLQLVRKAQELGQKCIVSIFVNPLQFGPSEDFDRYPRPFDDDLKKLDALGIDCVFAPSIKEFYPENFSTRVNVSGLSNALCGKSRPGFFEGVATVCLKLFQSTAADFAVYGDKDFQQLRVLQKMVEDLNLPLSILGHPIVREPDGLAMSSRNQYLSNEERMNALALSESLRWMRERAISDPKVNVGVLVEYGRESLKRAGLKLDYFEIASERDLAPADPNTMLLEIPVPRAFVAAWSGTTRLIDNMALLGNGV